MIIECTSCGTRAKLPDSKEGAKVRCPNCEHVYYARPAGARRQGSRAGGKGKEDPTKYFIMGGAVLVFGLIVMIASRGGSEALPVTPDVEPEPDLVVFDTGWDSPLVQFARRLHENTLARNSSKLLVSLDFRRVHEASGAGDATQGNVVVWSSLSSAEQIAFRNHVVDELMDGVGDTPIVEWKPFDGQVLEMSDVEGLVRLHVQHRDAEAGLEDRWIEWSFHHAPGADWLAYRWERWISPEEEKLARTRRKKKTVKKTLSDGSLVIEGEVRSEIAYHEETGAEVRAEIEGLIGQYLNLETRPKEMTAARTRLEELGKHAVPGLLKRMGSIPMDSEDNAIQLNLVHMLLTDITGYNTTFKVHVAMGGTEERIDSGIKQWFGWYDRKWKRFWTTADAATEAPDPFWDDPDFKPRNENERREYERLRREHEQGGGR